MTISSSIPTRDSGPASLLNAVFIGYMVGTYSVMGKGGAQAVANMAGEHVGKEILAYASSQGIILDTPHALAKFLQDNQLAEAVAFNQKGNAVTAQISKCGICPKKIGKYKFDGTACPWGGILIGILESLSEEKFSVAVRLTPGEICSITLQAK
jgi:hypothetical protein